MIFKYLILTLVVGLIISKFHYWYHNRQLEILDLNIIRKCTVPGTVALTFDDGPMIYTDKILDDLGRAGMKATFFVNGKNWSNITDYSSTILRMMKEGHQIGSHTWSHSDLTTVSIDEMKWQMSELDSALINMTGKRPTYARPPYFSVNRAVIETLGELGYRIIHTNLNTMDWANTEPETIDDSVRIFEDALSPSTGIVLAHDVWKQTAHVLVPAMIRAIQDSGLRAVTVGECLGDDLVNWYRTE